jgi:hypothetical protein
LEKVSSKSSINSVATRDFNDDVVDVDLQVAVDLLPETLLHALLEGGPSVSEAERHRSVAESTEGSDEGCGQLISGIHCDLVIPGVRI